MLNQQQQIQEQIKKAQSILITFGRTWSGDAVASALALSIFLKKIGKKAEIVAQKYEHSDPLFFLPEHDKIKFTLENLRTFVISLDASKAKLGQIKYRLEDNVLNFIISVKNGLFNHEDISSSSNNFRYDLVITLDTPDLESLGDIYEKNTDLFYRVPVINIDHHSSNEEYGQINYVDLTAVATSEILYGFFNNMSHESMDDDIATCILAGMISKTRSFKTPNITPQSLTVAAQLISLGARREEIVNNLYRSRPLNVFKLWGRVLERLSSALEEKMVWSSLTHQDFVATASTESDLADVIEELMLSMPLAKVIVIFYEKIVSGKIVSACLLHATTNIDATMLLKELSPVGTKIRAEAVLDKPIQEAEQEMIALIQDKLKKMSI